VIRPVEDKSALTVVIVTIGMFLALNSLAQFWFGTDAKTVTKPFSQTVWDIGEVRLEARILGLAVLLVVECLVLFVLLQRTKLGLALRAVSANVESSRLVGINTGVVLMAGWAAAAGLGALGGVAAISSQDLDASLMQRLLVFAFAATALGGFDSPLGAVVGGLVVGIADSLTKEYLDVVAGHTILQGIELVVPFALIATVLLVRPTGLFGRRVVERV
jgi:branched-chain amino acid transport system permease protein